MAGFFFRLGLLCAAATWFGFCALVGAVRTDEYRLVNAETYAQLERVDR